MLEKCHYYGKFKVHKGLKDKELVDVIKISELLIIQCSKLHSKTYNFKNTKLPRIFIYQEVKLIES